ncbi:hypothetical protein N2152v2_001074 [Parachlorella kessleri]
MSSSSDSSPSASASEAATPAERRARTSYSREELLAVKDQAECQKLPAGLEPDDLSDLMESVFFDKSSLSDRSPSGDIYLGPQRGPPPGLRPAFAGPRRTGFAAPPGAGGGGPLLHSRLLDDARSLSPERDGRGGVGAGGVQRLPSSGLTSAFAASPAKGTALAGRGRFDDASRMDRWDSNKLGPGGAAGGAPAAPGTSADDDSWTPRGRATRTTSESWRTLGGGAEPGTPGGAGAAGAALGAPRQSLERGHSGWGGRADAAPAGAAGAGAPGLSRAGTGTAKDGVGRWVKDDHDDWRSRKQSGALPEPRYDWADRTASGAVPAREAPPGFGAPAGRRGVPDWADEGEGPQRGPVTAADIEAERQRMQAQWKAQRAARDALADRDGGAGEAAHDEEHAQHGQQHPHRRHEEGRGGGATFLEEVMGDEDFESWARNEKAKQEAEDRADDEERRRREAAAAAAPKAGQQIDVKALFGGSAAGSSAPSPQPDSHAPAPAQPAAAARTDSVGATSPESGMRSRFANFFKLDESNAPDAQQPQQAQQYSQQPAFAAAGAPHGAQALQHPMGAAAPAAAGRPPEQAQQQQQQLQQLLLGQQPAPGDAAAAAAASANAGSMLLAMLKKQLPGAGGVPTGPPGPGILAQLQQQHQQQQAAAAAAAAGRAVSGDLDDVTQVAMSAALQGLDEALGEEEGLVKQAQQPQRQATPPQQSQHPQQPPQQQQQPQQPLALPPMLQAQQAQHAAMLATLGSRPMQPHQAQQSGLPPGMLGASGMHGLPGGLPQGPAGPPGYTPAGHQQLPPQSLPGGQYNALQHLMAAGLPQQQAQQQQQQYRPQYPGMPPPQQGLPQQPGYGYGGLPPQYRPPMGPGLPAGISPQPQQQQHNMLLQQQQQQQQAQQNALLAQLLAAQQRQQQAQQAQQRLLQQQQQQPQQAQQGQFNLAALLAAAGGGGNAAGAVGGLPGGMQPQGLNAAQLMGAQHRVPGLMPPNVGQVPGAAPSAQLQLLQQLQMAAGAGGGASVPGMPGAGQGIPGYGGPGQPTGQPGAGAAGMSAAQQQQLLGLLRMGGASRPQQ